MLLPTLCLLALATTAWSSPSSTIHFARLQATDLAGHSRSVPATGAKATVLLFVSTTCPYSNAAAPQMAKIANEYAAKGFAFLFVYGNPYGNPAETKQHARQYGFAQPAVLDTKQTLVHAVGATNTPEAVVIGPSGALLYRGRIDNQFSSVGVMNAVPTQHDLTDALDAISEGKAPAHAFEQPIGCGIPNSGVAPG